jgi:CYTH domain-containing protein
MNKTATTELHRTFLLEGLPEPLTRASSHLQIFDNYIEGTRIRLRNIRDPYSTAWTHILQQRFSASDADPAITKIAEIHLNDAEYAVFQRFEGREVRKNRYFHEFDRVLFAFDAYLGRLWGLNTARVDFESVSEMEKFVPPPFAIFEITKDPFFAGDNLIEMNFEAIQAEVARLGSGLPPAGEMPDE